MNPTETPLPPCAPWMSVVIPSFNQRDYLVRTLRSVDLAIKTLRNSSDDSPPVVTIWVQDGGSTDGTVAYLEAQAQAGVLGFTSARDGGQAAAINTAIREHSRGKWIGWLNSDDLWDAETLVRLYEAEARHAELAWFHGPVRIIDHDDREIRRWISKYKRSRSRSLTWNRLLLENLVAQMGTFFRREAFLKVGGLDPKLFYNMDYDLWLKLWNHYGAPGFLARDHEFVGSFRMVRGTKSMEGFRKQFEESLEVGLRYRSSTEHEEQTSPPPSVAAMKWARRRIIWIYEFLKFFRI